jgi:uncharacterized protein YndB with AHSA1/START domain
MENVARVQLKLKATPQRVFQALLDSHALTSWFSEFADVSSETKAYDFWGRFTPEAPATQEAGHHPLTLLAANRHLAYAWELNDVESQVLIKLLPRQDETILTVRQSAPADVQLTEGWSLDDFWFLSLENLRRHLDGKSSLARVDFSKPMLGEIRHELVIEAPAAKVFEVLIRPDQMDRWLANGAIVEPEPGGVYSFGWMSMKILEIVPDKKLAVGATAERDGKEVTSIVTWSLEESYGKTRMAFVHSGFAPDQSNAGENVGWLAFMNFVSSIAQYGEEWQSPVAVIKPEFYPYYSASMVQQQPEIVEELRLPNDPLLSTVSAS